MVVAETLQKGEIRCFPEDLTDERGRHVHAEVSAVVFDGERLIMASDKDIPGHERSPVFALDYDRESGPLESTLHYLNTPVIRDAAKYEDFALTPCGGYILATTGFDRIDDGSARLDHYNTLLAWPRGNPDGARVIDRAGPTTGTSSSLELREELRNLLETPYLKVEGLAAIPDGSTTSTGILLLGVRERGADKSAFDYVSEIVAADYRIDPPDAESPGVHLTSELRLLYDFVAHECEGDVAHECGLSSLEYDPHGQRLFLLTSFELDAHDGRSLLGGYLWELTLDDLLTGRSPHLVRHGDGQPVVFANKAEGLAMLGADRLFVVFDNDRELRLEEDRGRTERAHNEAPFTVMSLRG